MKKNKKIKKPISRINSIGGLISLIEIRFLPEKIRKCFAICLNSCRNSKFNFFFQVINFCLVLLIFWFIVPNKLESFINWSNWAKAILGNFILWVIGWSLLPIEKIFETSVKVTIFILFMIISFIIFCYVKLFLKMLSSIKFFTNKILTKIKYGLC